jgi:hypothetical protein
LLLGIVNQKSLALITGIALGSFSGYLIATSGYGAPTAIIVLCFVCPLIVSLISSQKTLWLAMVPNLLIWPTVSLVVQLQHPREKLSLFDVFGIAAFTIVLGLARCSYPYQSRSYVVTGERDEPLR